MGSETLPSVCYILSDESSIPFYFTSNGYEDVGHIIHFRHKSCNKKFCLLKVQSSLHFYLAQRCFCLISEDFVLNINHIINLLPKSRRVQVSYMELLIAI